MIKEDQMVSIYRKNLNSRFIKISEDKKNERSAL